MWSLNSEYSIVSLLLLTSGAGVLFLSYVHIKDSHYRTSPHLVILSFSLLFSLSLSSRHPEPDANRRDCQSRFLLCLFVNPFTFCLFFFFDLMETGKKHDIFFSLSFSVVPKSHSRIPLSLRHTDWCHLNLSPKVKMENSTKELYEMALSFADAGRKNN